MTVLDMRLNGGSTYQPSANQTDQASHAAAPEAHNDAIKAEHILLVVAVFMIAIYGLKVLGRVIKSVK